MGIPAANVDLGFGHRTKDVSLFKTDVSVAIKARNIKFYY
jgi:hypothetical protein